MTHSRQVWLFALCFMTWVLCSLAPGVAAGAGPASGPASAPAGDPDYSVWVLQFHDLLDGQGKKHTLTMYVLRDAGAFVSAGGSTRTWNVAGHAADVSKLEYAGGRLTGTMRVTVYADAWVPEDGKPIVLDVNVDAAIKPELFDKPGSIDGTYSTTLQGKKVEAKLGGILGKPGGIPLANCSLSLLVNNGWIGGDSGMQRRLSLAFSIRNGKAHGAKWGGVNLAGNAPTADSELPEGDYSAEVSQYGVVLKARVPYINLGTKDGDPSATYNFELYGSRVSNYIVGHTKVTVEQAGRDPVVHEGNFKGSILQPWPLAAVDPRPWFKEVKGHVPVQPGEHPRLFFRKSDIPELRKRAQTPEGQALIKRLRFLLDGKDGEGMPTSYNASSKAYDGKGVVADDDKETKVTAGPGTYTISHVAGYGFLYQLTGDKKYAELGRQCFEKALAGVRDRDDRYSWASPGGQLRAGPSVGWYAVGYDLCYDGWDPEYRKKVAALILEYQAGGGLQTLAIQSRHGPSSNHFGPQVGGAALALMAILGDPGVDREITEKLLATAERNVQRNGALGWGDRGMYHEGDGPGAISSDTAYLPAIQALRVCMGRDYGASEHTNIPWMTMKWVMYTLPPGTPRDVPKRGGYQHNVLKRTGMSGAGQFAQGFGVIPPEQKPALLWTYNHLYRAADEKHNAIYDTPSEYPHRAMLAFINWPWDQKEADPGAILPVAVRDSMQRDFFAARNRWRDSDDILVFNQGSINVWGFRERLLFPGTLEGQINTLTTSDRTFVLTSGSSAFGGDFSGTSGADGLLVLAGPKPKDLGALKASDKIKVQAVATPGTKFTVMTLSGESRHPAVTVEKDQLVIGGQRVKFEKGALVWEVTKPAPAR